MRQELHQLFRSVIRRPAWCLAAITVIGVTVGVNTAVFSVVNAMLFRPFPVHAPNELMYVYSRQNDQLGGISYRAFEYLRDQTSVFSQLAASGRDLATARGRGVSATIPGEIVSAEYFEVLGVQAKLGQGFGPNDAHGKDLPVVVISDRLWRTLFASDPDILGTPIVLLPRIFGRTAEHGTTYIVVGVMGPGFIGLANPWEPTDYWVPVLPRSVDYRCDDPQFLDSGNLTAIGRLRSDVSKAQAEAIMEVSGQFWQRSYLADSRNWSLVVLNSRRISLPFDPSGKIVPARFAIALMLSSGLLLLVAVANLSGLLMARMVTRRNEIAVRMVLGASTRRVVFGMVAESVALALVGGVAGLPLARALVHMFLNTVPRQFGFATARAVSVDVPLDLNVFVFTGLSCILVGVFVSVVPALQVSRMRGTDAVSTDHIASPRFELTWIQRVIIIPQICLSVTLLILTAALLKVIVTSEVTRLGYDTAGLVFVEFELGRPGRCRGAAEQKAYVERRRQLNARLLDSGTSSSGAASASLAFFLPMDNRTRASVITRQELEIGAAPRFVWRFDVSAGYFETLGIKIVRGRGFATHDDQNSERVAILSQALASLLWRSLEPIGEQVALYEAGHTSKPQWMTVVGIVSDVMPAISDAPARPAIYMPLEQGIYGRTLVARYRADAAQGLRALQKTIIEADDDAEIVRASTATDAVAAIRYPRRLVAAVLLMSGAAALLLASIGMYGLMSHAVSRRLRELGVRAALGAQRRDLVMLFVRDAIVLASLGSTCGIILAQAAVRVTSALVLPVSTVDLSVLVGVPLILGCVVVGASYVPARRGVRAEPSTVLRAL